MKMDMVNFTINNIRPQLQMQSVEYERTKFQAILDQTPSEYFVYFNITLVTVFETLS